MQQIEAPAAWYVAYTMPRSEKKAFQSLQRMGMTSFFPVHHVLKKWSDRIKRVELPLFPSYIFIHTTPQRRFEAIDAPEIIRYISFEGRPAVVPDNILESLMKVSGGELEVLEDKFHRVGMPVIICEGPFAGIKGTLIRKNGRSKLLILVHALKSAVSVEIPASAAQPLESTELSMQLQN